MPTFSSEYNRLNAEQKKAVDTVEGPVMVVAGPGTGKTQVLAMRVASILQKTHAKPSNILCLTFSTSGAVAMRSRLRTIIGSDAYGVTVSTVHGFCDSIITRNAVMFSEWESKKALSDLGKYKLLQTIVDAVSSTSALINPKNPYDRIPDILGRISDCKREGKTLLDLQRVAREHDAVMEDKSKKGTKQHEKNLLQARKFREFTDLFKRYQEALEEQSLYDYDDMILTVIAAFSDEEWLLQSLQERYQYILVDEAQDLNGAQWQVIEKLTTYAAVPHEPNFFLVGDDDQSVYRFQGANMEHLMGFRERFPKAPVIVLTTNYRSTQKILDAAGRLILHNEERLIGRIPGLKKDLKAFTKDEGTDPVLLRAPSDAAEPWLLADLIAERLEKGIPPQEISVLVQTNAELMPIYDVLRAREIPVILMGKSDLLTHSLVSQALTILRSIESSSDDDFIHALCCECFACHPADIGRVIAAARALRRKTKEFLLSIETADIAFTNREALLHARDLLLDLEQKQHSRSVLDTIEHVLRESGLSESAEDLDPLDLAAIEAFFHYVKKRCLDHPFLSLREFMSELNLYADEGYSQLRLTYQMPHLVTEGVQLLTAHQSKGLEFQSVFLTGFREGHWDERKARSGLSVPEDLLFGWETEQKRFEKHQDERRVAYVAMTRAKRELFMLCPKEFSVGERARPVAPSAFFSEAGPLPEFDGALKDAEKSSLLLLRPERKLGSELEAYLRERIAGFALSPSSLSAFLGDPKEFRRLYLLGQPEKLSESSVRSLAYGSAVHYALKEWAGAMKQGLPFALREILSAFQWYLEERTILTKKQCEDLLSQAKDALPLYVTNRLQGTVPCIYAVEREYRAILSDSSSAGIPLKGKIDRIDTASPTSADAVIIDYKTGRPKAPAAIRGGIESGTVSRTRDGDNFRQLVFYALLLEQAEPMLVPVTFSLEFIGERGEEPAFRQFSILETEKEDLRSLIRQVWSKILALDFTPL
ncbi:ATP-dependent helicase [Candidatus Peribacteria bacterium]|nr:ATP-dependent helicase [Candidatus Peribacteria bacterium]